jgi:hypothetical protein
MPLGDVQFTALAQGGDRMETLPQRKCSPSPARIGGDKGGHDDSPPPCRTAVACPCHRARPGAGLERLCPSPDGAHRNGQSDTGGARRSAAHPCQRHRRRYADVPAGEHRGRLDLARLRAVDARTFRLQFVVALSEYRRLPAVRRRRQLPRWQLRHGADPQATGHRRGSQRQPGSAGAGAGVFRAFHGRHAHAAAYR